MTLQVMLMTLQVMLITLQGMLMTLQVMLMTFQVMPKTALTQEDASAYNILFLGPTGSGRFSSIISNSILIMTSNQESPP